MLALFEELGAPERLSVLVEGESLLNDGVGVVVFSALLDEHPDIRRAELGIGERPDRAGRRERYPADRPP